MEYCADIKAGRWGKQNCLNVSLSSEVLHWTSVQNKCCENGEAKLSRCLFVFEIGVLCRHLGRKIQKVELSKKDTKSRIGKKRPMREVKWNYLNVFLSLRLEYCADTIARRGEKWNCCNDSMSSRLENCADTKAGRSEMRNCLLVFVFGFLTHIIFTSSTRRELDHAPA